MLSRYKWDRLQLLKEKEQLASMSYNIMGDNNIYDDMLSIIDHKNKFYFHNNSIAEGKIELQTFSRKIKKELTMYQTQAYSEVIMDYLYELAQEIMEIPTIKRDPLPYNYFTEQKIVNTALSFFKDFDEEYYAQTVKLIDRKNSIHLMNGINDARIRGICYFSPFFEKPYVMSTRLKTTEDILAMNHETMHSNEDLLYLKSGHVFRSPLLQELGAVYIEQATIDYLAEKGINQSETLILKQKLYNDDLYQPFYSFIINYKIIEYLKKHKKHIEYIEPQDIRSHLLKEGIKDRNITQHLNGKTLEDTKYATAYLIANTIYTNFNKEEQVSILKELGRSPTTAFDVLENHGIGFSSKEHVKSLKKHVKTLYKNN